MITDIDRNTGETFIGVRAEPLAQLDTSREVLLVWTQKYQQPTPETEQETTEAAETQQEATAPAETSADTTGEPADVE